MRTQNAICISSLLILSLLINSTSAQTVSVDEIEDQVLAYRSSLTSGQVKVNSIVQFQDGSTRHTNYTFYFDGDKRRVDFDDDYSRPNHIRAITTRSRSVAWGEDAFRLFPTAKSIDGANLISVIAPLTSKRAEGEECSDVRMIGMYPVSFANLRHFKLNSRIGRRDDNNTTVELSEEVLRDLPHYLLAYASTSGADEVWVCPSRSYNVSRIVRRARDGNVRGRLDVDLSEVSGVGWFPRRVSYSERDGDAVEKSESLVVDVVQLNEELPPDTWKFAGMGAPVGQTIHNSTNNKQLKLDEDGVTLQDVR